MKKVFLTFISTLKLDAYSNNEIVEFFSFGARSKYIKPDNLVSVSIGMEVYEQLIFKLYGIKILDTKEKMIPRSGIYGNIKNLNYSLNLRKTLPGVLNVEVSCFWRNLMGPNLKSTQIETGKEICVRFFYEKDSLVIIQEVENDFESNNLFNFVKIAQEIMSWLTRELTSEKNGEKLLSNNRTIWLYNLSRAPPI